LHRPARLLTSALPYRKPQGAQMKVTVNVDCTPEEARRFLGLPDLTPVHQAYVDKLQRTVSDGITPDMVTDMMKSWGPMTEAGLGVWRQMFEQMSGKK
jgi:hypothetical protein